jgi:hypothetical protein
MENIQENFFSKNNISLLNNKLLENLNVKNLNEKQRIYIAQTIVNNMKIIWKNIDINKIKPENFQSVLKQFNSIVYKNSFEEIKKIIAPKENNFIDSNQKKYERDFKSNPNNGVIVHERPESMMKKNNSWLGPNEQYVINSQEIHNLANQPDRNLDNLFRPIVDKIPEEAKFNNYTIGKGTDFKEKLQDIQRMRDTEVPKSRKAESDLPDFLKSRSTSVRTQEDFSEKKNINQYNNDELNFIEGADDNENLFSLDNIDKPLINDNDYKEDPSPFADRLNKLKNDRENIQIPQQKTIDFKSENFNDIQPTIIAKLKNKNENNIKKHKQKLTLEQLELFNKLKSLNNNLMLQLSTYKDDNKQLRYDNLELAEKLQEIIHKEKLLKEKEKELDEKYGSLINTKTFQLEINPDSSISNYRYNFINTMNISGIKLTACSIPFKKFNIEYDINNLFLYTINNIEKNIILSEGYYTIQEIINNLNLNQNELIFELNSINQKIKVMSELKFNIVPTTLSIINLGFKSNCNNNSVYIADTIHDLRINNKVYLYFKNISNEPISIITPNTNIYDSELLFENSVKLNYLDIIFKDENDNDYNFYNISHYIHLNLISIT